VQNDYKSPQDDTIDDITESNFPGAWGFYLAFTQHFDIQTGLAALIVQVTDSFPGQHTLTRSETVHVPITSFSITDVLSWLLLR